jgi:hypothetical protein
MRSKKVTRVGLGLFDFASVGLAAAAGHLSMDAFAAYLEAMRPKVKPKKRRSP